MWEFCMTQLSCCFSPLSTCKSLICRMTILLKLIEAGNPQKIITDLNTIFQVVLSPIQELDSHQNTITANTPGAAALAQAVLAGSLNSAGLGTATMLTTTQHPITMGVSPVTFTTVSMSNPMLSSLGITPSSAPHTPIFAHRSLVLTDVSAPTTLAPPADDSSTGDRSRKASVTSQPKRGEVYV